METERERHSDYDPEGFDLESCNRDMHRGIYGKSGS
jgi:hypothetical protein